MNEGVRHVLGISGGKDSAALAIYMRDKVAGMEYFFTDTGAELPETYDFLDRLEAYLGKPIARLASDRDFDHLLKNMHNGFLPSPRTRWCTRELKIRPFEQWIGEDEAISYIAIRSDEDRDGYVSTKQNIRPMFPFKEAGIDKAGVMRILEECGLGIPAYYKWRSRSGCYFCFFQRKSEWVGLAEEHPDLFEKAKKYEKIDEKTGERYSWSQGETLEELIARAASIKAAVIKNEGRAQRKTWQEQLSEDESSEDEACFVCHL